MEVRITKKISEAVKTLVQILEDNIPIDIAKYINYVSQAGAIATFSGITRDTFEVSAVHRADALDACKFLIDKLKASVPIWKNEVYDTGEGWDLLQKKD
ncbi:hypothetical protein HS088_TW22G01278 [Tripterygium wilfordii]|uniref:Molybdopterin synthase catalytic subunit n=1 Tax=Tripterygium wilfordii TaxID=458696 RepID=A0A7J7C0F4_TRIWF|nr:hypothetical protein HS088_TW22G01278 [Tripterygium wilfordii]